MSIWTGIDIGEYSVKVVQVRKDWRGRLKITAAARFLRGRSSDNTPQVSDQTLINILHHIFSAGGIPPKNAIVSIGGRDLNLRLTLVPPMRDSAKIKKMMEYEIAQIAGKSVDEVYSDYAVITMPDKTHPEWPVLVGLAKRAYVDALISLLRDNGIKGVQVYSQTLALAAVLKASLKNMQETVLLVDIGTNNLNLVIMQKGNLIFGRNLVGGGGDSFTKSLADTFKISFEQAENLKKTEADLSHAHNHQTDSLAPALLSPTGQIHSLIQSSISFAKDQLKMEELVIDRVLLSGGGARLKGLAEHLARTINKPVEVFQPFQEIDWSELKNDKSAVLNESSSDMSVALGLALSEGTHKIPRLSFLPPAVKKMRHFYQETIYYLSSAVLVLLGILLVIISIIKTNNSLKANLAEVQGTRDQMKQITAKFKTEWNKKEQLAREYQAYLAEAERGVFFTNTLLVINQLLPQGIWISEMTLGRSYQLPNSYEVKYDPEIIVVKGYLEDNDSATLERFEKFQNDIQTNQIYPLVITPEKKLNPVEGPSSKGKIEFEILIKKKSD